MCDVKQLRETRETSSPPLNALVEQDKNRDVKPQLKVDRSSRHRKMNMTGQICANATELELLHPCHHLDLNERLTREGTNLHKTSGGPVIAQYTQIA